MNLASSWSFAVTDWEERLYAGKSLMPDLPLDMLQANRAVAMFNRLRLHDVPLKPTLGEAGGEWFREIVRAVFGSVVAGIRMVPGVFILVPKKNSKTTNSGAVMLVALLMNERPNARFGLFGPTQAIADLAFAAVSGMVAADEDLSKLLYVRDHLKMVENRLTGAVLKVTTFDLKVATGGLYAGWLLDEIHLLGSVNYAKNMIGQLRGASVSIPEAFGIIITTQSLEPPAGAFKEELDYARGIRDGRIEEGTVLPIIYEYPEAVQTDPQKPWQNPEMWPLVLPNLGRSVSLPILLKLHRTANDKGEEAIRSLASQHLNIEIGLALHSNRWAGADFWLSRSDRSITLEVLIRRCEVAVVGIDGGGMDDMLGLCVLGRERETRKWLVWCRAWVHQKVLDLRKDIAPRLLDFVKDGDLYVLPDETTEDVEQVADIVCQLRDAGLLPVKSAIGVDPSGINDIVDELERRDFSVGVEGEVGQIVPVRQGYTLQNAVMVAERRVAQGNLIHDGSPMMTWCVGNAKVEQKGNAKMITKQNAGSAKIDPVMAMFDAVTLMGFNPVAESSVYETRGLRVA